MHWRLLKSKHIVKNVAKICFTVYLGVARLVCNQDYFIRLISTAITLAMMLTMAAQILSLTAFCLATCFPFGFPRLTCSLTGFLIAFLWFIVITSFLMGGDPTSCAKDVGSTFLMGCPAFEFHLDCQRTRGSLMTKRATRIA